MRIFRSLLPRPRTKKGWLSFCLLGAAFFGLCYLIFQRLAPPEAPPAQPVVVAVTPAQYQNIPVSVNAIGSLVAPQATMLKAQQAGVVSKIYFKNGQNVAQNQLLVQLKSDAAEAMYEKAKAAMIEAKNTYDRYQKLQKQAPEVLSQLQIDQVLSNYKQAKAAMNAAAVQVQNMQVRAPFAGTTGATSLATGSYVNQGDDVVAIVNRSTLEITYDLPESYYGQVQLGQQVTFTSDAYSGKAFKAQVDYVAPLVSEQNRAFSVRALVDNHQKQLSPGMLVNLTQILKTNNKVLAVPAISLVTDMSGYAVYTVENGKVLSLPVQVGQRFGDWVEITSGINAGTEIISAGQEKVQPGSTVTVMGQGN
jgi:membrane fusion protein, multidrug efflux system